MPISNPEQYSPDAITIGNDQIMSVDMFENYPNMWWSYYYVLVASHIGWDDDVDCYYLLYTG